MGNKLPEIINKIKNLPIPGKVQALIKGVLFVNAAYDEVVVLALDVHRKGYGGRCGEIEFVEQPARVLRGVFLGCIVYVVVHFRQVVSSNALVKLALPCEFQDVNAVVYKVCHTKHSRPVFI